MTEAVGVLPERWDGHTVLLYENEEERLTAVGAFVRRGVERGEKVLLAVAPDDDGEAFLASCLTTPVAASARGTGQVALLPLGEFYPPVGQHEVAARALAQGYPGVRLTAPATGALTVMSPTDYLALEHATDERCRSGTVSALCQYAHSSWRGHLLPETLAAHRDGLRSPVLDVEAMTGGVRVSGEVDVVNRDLLEAAVTVARHSLRASEQAAAPELRVDLSGLEFIDVSGCRVLLQCADELLAAGGRLVLVAPRPHIRRTLRLAQPDSGARWHLVEFPRE